MTQGMNSTTTVQASYPRCSVTVYLTGTHTLATIYADSSNTPLANPFTANTNASWLFYSTTGTGVDVVMQGGTPLSFPSPFALTDLIPGGSGGGGGAPGGVNFDIQCKQDSFTFCGASIGTDSITKTNLAGSGWLNAAHQTPLGQFNYYRTNGVYSALMAQTGGGNNGIANAQSSANTNGMVEVSPDYADTEVMQFSPFISTQGLDKRDGSTYRLFRDPTQSYTTFDRSVWGTDPPLSGNYNKDHGLSISTNEGYGNTDDAGGAITSYGHGTVTANGYKPGLQSLGTKVLNCLHDEDCNVARTYVGYGGDVQSSGAEGIEHPDSTNRAEFKYIMGGGSIDQVTSTNQVHVGNHYGNIIAGTILEDTSVVRDTGCLIIAETPPVGSGYPRTVTTDPSCPHTQSNAWGQISVPVPQAANFKTGSPFTATVVLAHGSFSTSGGSACFVGYLQSEEAPYTATAASGGSQSVTFTLRHSSSNAPEFAVDGHCSAMRFLAERQSDGSGIISAPYYIVVGAPDTTHYWVLVSRGLLANSSSAPVMFGSQTAAYIPVPFPMTSTSRTSNIVTSTINNFNSQPSYRLIGTHNFIVSGCADSTFNVASVSLTASLAGDGTAITYTQPGSNANATTTGCSISLVGLNGFDVVGMAFVASVTNPAITPGSGTDGNNTPEIDGTYFLFPHDSALFAVGHTVEQPHAPRLGVSNLQFGTQASPGEAGTSRENNIESHSYDLWGNTGPGFVPYRYQFFQDPTGFQGNGGVHPPGNIWFQSTWIGQVWNDIPAPVGNGTVYRVHCPFFDCTKDQSYSLFTLDQNGGSVGVIGHNGFTKKLTLSSSGGVYLNTNVYVDGVGDPHMPTQVPGTNDNRGATTAFVQAAATALPRVTNIVTTSPIVGGPITTTGTISCPTCLVVGNVIHNDAANIQGTLFATATMLGPVFYEPNNALMQNIVIRLSGTISCTVAPTVEMMNLGTSPSTAYGGATSISTNPTGTSDGVYANGPALGVVMTAGHYYGFAFSAGTCVTAPTFDIVATVQ
jgi:hypothetical protein